MTRLRPGRPTNGVRKTAGARYLCQSSPNCLYRLSSPPASNSVDPWVKSAGVWGCPLMPSLNARDNLTYAFCLFVIYLLAPWAVEIIYWRLVSWLANSELESNRGQIWCYLVRTPTQTSFRKAGSWAEISTSGPENEEELTSTWPRRSVKAYCFNRSHSDVPCSDFASSTPRREMGLLKFYLGTEKSFPFMGDHN